MTITTIGDGLRIVVGGNRVLDEGIGVIGRAQKSISGELFKLTDPTARDLLRSKWGSGLGGSALITAHPQSIEQLDAVAGPNMSVGSYGDLVPRTAPRQYIHSKTVARDVETDDPEAWIATGSLDPATRSTWEIAGVTDGDTARAVGELASSAVSRDYDRWHSAIDSGRKLGLYVVDPVTQNRGYAEGLEEIARTEPTGLTVITKSFFDERYARELADRRTRDHLPVTVIMKRVDEASERILREADVQLWKPAVDQPVLHGNVTIGHGLGVGMWGTLWASPRGFARPDVPNPFTGGAGTLPRSQWWDRSRELGAATADPTAIHDLLEGVELLRARPHDFRGEVARVGGP